MFCIFESQLTASEKSVDETPSEHELRRINRARIVIGFHSIVFIPFGKEKATRDVYMCSFFIPSRQ